ncbi:hypothetical protein [Xylophilus sp. GOD-11R]|uniref:hypothetical protein n=1 Tax=Xylophilus sp. GOD-11R TaxID=3089814 RepID=UPI00298C965D|nr:hypothetical protein [Xylophilus sp. GOD-11R]WPB58610.1 hypothetical protein R9X41_08240 [Xylophilus sp. GOD-11R]
MMTGIETRADAKKRTTTGPAATLKRHLRKVAIAAAAMAAFSAAQAIEQASGGGQDWGPMPWPTTVNLSKTEDFLTAARLIEQTVGDKEYADRFQVYRMCTELALRNLPTYAIDPVGAMVYTAVRGCTRQMDSYVLLFVQDPRFKADYYVAHAIQRIAQQDRQIELLPLAERLQRPTIKPSRPGMLDKVRDFFNVDARPKQEQKVSTGQQDNQTTLSKPKP